MAKDQGTGHDLSAAAAMRLRVSRAGLASNWRTLRGRSNAGACGAVVKADAYGLGAAEVVSCLAKAGCRDFFVSTWRELQPLRSIAPDLGFSVLHGMRPGDMALALSGLGRPVLSSPVQVDLWKQAAGGACDVMIDTGLNRLGLRADEVGHLADLSIDTLMTHLASAEDAENPANARQLETFRKIAALVPAKRYSMANSAALYIPGDYALSLARPGLALYGGRPTATSTDIEPVVRLEAEVLQVRDVPSGECVGYGGAWRADRDSRIALLNIGYADGYVTGFANQGEATLAQGRARVAGRVSMDLTAVDVTGLDVSEGDWAELDFDLAEAAALVGVSQYELLVGLGRRFDRRWE